jgi:predicted negative regulator of RcsB-dependent stress response
MDGSNWPIVLIEVVLVFGGVLAFGWWQLRDLAREREAAQRRRAAPPASETRDTDGPAPD